MTKIVDTLYYCRHRGYSAVVGFRARLDIQAVNHYTERIAGTCPTATAAGPVDIPWGQRQT